MKKIRFLWTILTVFMLILCGCEGAAETDTQSNLPGTTSEQTGGSTQGELSDTAAGQQNGEQQMMEYVQPEMAGEITIACFNEEEFLKIAARQFMDRYPDVTVTIYSCDATGEGAIEDYLTVMNTKIMTGKAEDIIMTNFLPIHKYSEMGVFEDLSGYISAMPEFNDENYYMNVLLSAKETDGSIYLIPYLARFNVIGFSEALLEEQGNIGGELDGKQSIRFSSAMEIAERLTEGSEKRNVFLQLQTETYYMELLIEDSLSQFIDLEQKQAYFNTAEYIALLESVKALSEKGYFDSSNLDFYNEEYYFATITDFDVQAAFYALDERADWAYCMPYVNEDGKFLMLSNQCVALNSASENKDLAWEFIRYLLSDEVQTLPSIHGPAVSRSGFAAAAERYYNYYENGSNGTAGVDKEEYAALLESWMEQINGCGTLDSDLVSLIAEENNKYFEEEQTAEETARILQEKVTQYLNE